MKSIAKERLEEFIIRFKEAESKTNLKKASEQSIRSWIDEFLGIFGWDTKNLLQIEQEKVLDKRDQEKLKIINSTHKKPDYTLKNGKIKLEHLDAKDLEDNIKEDKAIAFQVRSYGWSSGMICSMVTNIKEFAVYDCRFKPNETDASDLARVYFTIDEYIEKFDVLYDLLSRENIVEGKHKKFFEEQIKDVIKKTMDEAFAEKLTEVRLNLAKEIYKNNSFMNLDSQFLNTMAQSIINRILFIRICEARGLEKEEFLVQLCEKDFWKDFQRESKEKFETTYDGPIFNNFPELERLNIDNKVLVEFVKQLYYPSPYRFDVMPIQTIASMYEHFLVNEIKIDNGEVKQEMKAQYVKQQGAVSTPKYMVDFMVDNLLQGLKEINSLEELLEVTILEPACGSGTYILSILNYLEEKAIELFKENKVKESERKLFVKLDNEVYCTSELKRLIIRNCLYAIDMDAQAVEVAKVSIALNIIENNGFSIYNEKLGLFEDKLLNGIGTNIIHGNTLVEFDIMDLEKSITEEELFSIVPCNIKNIFKKVFAQGGFKFIIGNPPYVETKNYIETYPKMREYLKEKYSFDNKKADMCIYFIERGIHLLDENGKLSYICQKRFFKTSYGENARKYLANQKCIEKIIDFKTQDIFSKRDTYVAILDISKRQNDGFQYCYVQDEEITLRNNINNIGYLTFTDIDYKVLEQDTWNLGEDDSVRKLIEKLIMKFGTISDIKGKELEGGIQVLNNKVYHINAEIIDESKNIIKGKNKLNQDVEIELSICKPIMKNKELYKFQPVETHMYGIFPYENYTQGIDFVKFKRDYPKCAAYLEKQKVFLSDFKMRKEPDKWHLYTRVLNHDSFSKKKIIYPMTAKEVTATYSYGKGIYLDNANMWGLTFGEKSDEFYEAVTAVLNSTVFNTLAIYFANPQRGNYYKLNKQFMLPVPFPYEKIENDKTLQKKLSDLVKEIIDKQEKINNPLIESKKQVLETLIQRLYLQLDTIVCDLYELNSEEIAMIKGAAIKKE